MTMLQSNIEGYPVRRGKVRDIYELGSNMLIIVTSDRISAFDYVLPSGIPDKGKILTAMSEWWFEQLEVNYHIITTDIQQMPEQFRTPEMKGRAMLVERAEVIPFECVVRGYLCGSGWKDYKRTGEVCGHKLPVGLRENQQFPVPIFTPATKAETGHDENISIDYMASKIGKELTATLEQKSVELYIQAAEMAWHKGIIIADTKFEWGLLKHANDELVLIDEVMTPDSSRFWPLDAYQLGISMPSFDKQYVRDWLSESGWDKNSPPPELPQNVILQTRDKYVDAYERITGKRWQND